MQSLLSALAPEQVAQLQAALDNAFELRAREDQVAGQLAKTHLETKQKKRQSLNLRGGLGMIAPASC